jgi:hypothetical protein
MTYQEQSDEMYRNTQQRARMGMCVREQGLVYASDPDPVNAALGQGVVAGDVNDIDAVLAAVSVDANWQTIQTSDPDLKTAVQAVWPTVAAARHPEVTAR